MWITAEELANGSKVFGDPYHYVMTVELPTASGEVQQLTVEGTLPLPNSGRRQEAYRRVLDLAVKAWELKFSAPALAPPLVHYFSFEKDILTDSRPLELISES